MNRPLASAALVLALTFQSAFAQNVPAAKTPVEKAANESQAPREPVWLPVRELRVDALPVSFELLEQLPGGREKKKVRQQTAVALRGIYPRQEQVEAIVAALSEMVEAHRRGWELSKPQREASSDRWEKEMENLFGKGKDKGKDKDKDKKEKEVLPREDKFDPGTLLEVVADFEIERQESARPPASWDKVPWKAVSIDNLGEVLRSAVDIDDEPGLHPAEAGWGMACPLPVLKTGKWDERVLHPRLKDNKLPKSTELERRTVREKARYVLFRYLDLDVKEGFSYRYRIRLEHRNPAFESELVPAAIAQGEKRQTPWSEPSPVVTVKGRK